METTRTVRGCIVLPAGSLPPNAAEVIVMLEDISRADAPSILIAEQRQTGVPLHPGAVIPFHIEIPDTQIDERRNYSVRAHVDLSGSGRVKVGDLVSTQTYPVLTRGHGDKVRVNVRTV